MAMTADEIRIDALGLAYPFIREESISPSALLRHINILDEEVVNHFVLNAPERLSVAVAQVITQSLNAAGYTLTASRAFSNFQLFNDDDTLMAPVRIVAEDEFDHPPIHPAGIIRNLTFFPCDPSEMRWATSNERQFFTDGQELRYRRIAEPTRLTAFTNALASPDEVRQYFNLATTLYVLLLSGEAPETRLQYAAAQVTEQRRMLGMIAGRRTATSSTFGR